MTPTKAKKGTAGKSRAKGKAAKSGRGAKKAGDKKKKLEDRLGMKKELTWEKLDNRKVKAVMNFSEDYKNFLDECKTERETIDYMVRELKSHGFKPIDKVKGKPKAGTRLYEINREKNLAITIIGKQPLAKGVNLVASHVDTPRLDLKQNPLYEDGETRMALLKTHYYGGIKKYQWVSIPLAIHGKIIRSDGKEQNIRIGDEPGDPVFVIPDLLPHLARKRQGSRKFFDGIKGEELNILIGSLPIKDKSVKKKVKIWILDHLHKKYGIVEEDFISAELEVVPAGKSVDVGFDKSMVGAYGQDDRICAYTSFKAILDIKIPEYTSMCLMVDKEEIGSDGPTSIRSRFLVDAIGNVRSNKIQGTLRRCKRRS
jgi:aspartyl aminopeptidase